jgi:hypothetical protein
VTDRIDCLQRFPILAILSACLVLAGLITLLLLRHPGTRI